MSQLGPLASLSLSVNEPAGCVTWIGSIVWIICDVYTSPPLCLRSVHTIFTDRVRSTTGRLCFDTCLSICLSTPRGVSQPGLMGGTPPWVPSHQTWPGVPLLGGFPTSGTPPGRAWLGVPLLVGVPLLGGYPTSGNPPVRPGWGGYPCCGYLCQDGTPAGGVPHLR